MGLTHFSILNSLDPNLNFSVIEPNKILRNILKKNINAKLYSDDSTLKESFDITLITTPPSLHLQLLNFSDVPEICECCNLSLSVAEYCC